MPVEDPDEDQPGGPPPHPLDRVWFHPSEVGAALAAWRAGPETHRGRDWGLPAIVAVLSVAVTVGVLAAAGAFAGSTTTTGHQTVVQAPPPAPWADVVNSVAPSVVSIRAAGTAGQSLGSGVAMDSSRVLTSTSLLASASTITVTTANGHLSPAAVLGSDPDSDLTLLSVDGADLPAAKLGSSAGLEVGDGVLAVGLAPGNHRWATEGIVSALDQLSGNPTGGVLPGFVVTNLSVSGNAMGGPLVDSGGAVVGILSAAQPGQAVPIDLASDVVQQLKSSGAVHHGWLGVSTVDVQDRPGTGAMITVVAPSGPAAAAGLEAGDVVTAVTAGGNTEHVANAGDLVYSVEGLHNGDPATITVTRGTGHTSRTVTLGDRRQDGGVSLAGWSA